MSQAKFNPTVERSYQPSSATIGLDKAQRLLMIGAGCLIIVFIFGVILCRLDISAGKRRRAAAYQEVETNK